MVERFGITFMVRLDNYGANPIANHFNTVVGDCPELKLNAVFVIFATKGTAPDPATG